MDDLTITNSTTLCFFIKTTLYIISLVPKLPNKMGNRNKLFVPSTISSILFSFNPIFWVKVLHIATRLLNPTPSISIKNKMRFTKLYKKQPTFTHPWVFGFLCYPLIPTQHKFAPYSTPCLFFGYPSNHRGICFFDLATDKNIISLHVHFDKTIFPIR